MPREPKGSLFIGWAELLRPLQLQKFRFSISMGILHKKPGEYLVILPSLQILILWYNYKCQRDREPPNGAKKIKKSQKPIDNIKNKCYNISTKTKERKKEFNND